MDVRARAKAYLDAVPPLGQQITSTGATAGLFTKLTGTTHATLAQNWAGGGIRTTCNDFVGTFARAMGTKEYLGRFDLATYLPKIGKGHAWVPAKSGARPGYGDLVRFASFHMGVSLDFDGGTWNTVESGQGGPKAGCDIIKRKQREYDAGKIEGWVDLAVYLDVPAQKGPMPEELAGWWKVMWRGEAFYYYFTPDRRVVWTQMRPHVTTKPPALPGDSGVYSVDASSQVTIRWGATGSVERLGAAPAAGGVGSMTGTWNGIEPLTAERM